MHPDFIERQIYADYGYQQVGYFEHCILILEKKKVILEINMTLELNLLKNKLV